MSPFFCVALVQVFALLLCYWLSTKPQPSCFSFGLAVSTAIYFLCNWFERKRFGLWIHSNTEYKTHDLPYKEIFKQNANMAGERRGPVPAKNMPRS